MAWPFAHWVNEPGAQSVLHGQIFFDARTVVGDASLWEQVRAESLAIAAHSPRFLAHLASQAVERQPPLGFFRGFVLARFGEHHDHLDIKAGGVHAVVELARVQALAHALAEVGTLERLRGVASLTSSPRLAELGDAFEFISHVRLAHHARQLREGQPLDNLVRAEALTSFDKRHLEDAFTLVRQAQEALAYTYQTHLMS